MRRDPGRRLGPQLVSLLDTEPVLLVDDHHAQLVEFDRVLQQRVGADDDADLAAGDLAAHLFLLRPLTSSR